MGLRRYTGQPLEDFLASLATEQEEPLPKRAAGAVFPLNSHMLWGGALHSSSVLLSHHYEPQNKIEKDLTEG